MKSTLSINPVGKSVWDSVVENIIVLGVRVGKAACKHQNSEGRVVFMPWGKHGTPTNIDKQQLYNNGTGGLFSTHCTSTRWSNGL